MKLFILLSFIVLPFSTLSQNLITNGSFEDTTMCPLSCGKLTWAVDWYNPTLATPDLFHSCSNSCNYNNGGGYQLPRTGIAYGGYLTGNPQSNGREYVETVISTPLVAGECYHIEFYISATIHQYITDAVQVYFSDTLISALPIYTVLPFTPQIYNTIGNFPDTINWTLVQGDYAAHGGESYIIIGNFLDTANSTYVQQLPNPPAAGGSYHYIDDVSLTHISCTGIKETVPLVINTFPNPALDIIFFELNKNESMELSVFNTTSQLCMKLNFFKSIDLDISRLSPGIYYYQILNKQNFISGKFLVY